MITQTLRAPRHVSPRTIGLSIGAAVAGAAGSGVTASWSTTP